MNQAVNPVSKILSFLNPQANRERLENVGLYKPRDPIMQPNLPRNPATGAAGGFSMGTPVEPVRHSPSQGSGGVKGNGKQSYNRDAVGRAIKFYTDQGYDPRFAAAMAGNIQVESGGDPNAFNDEEGAFGIFQHRHDRLSNLREFAERQGMSANDINAQLSFALHEFQTTEKAAYEKIFNGDVSPQTAGEYAALIDQHYERSSGAHRQKRMALSEQIYADFFGDGVAVPVAYNEDGSPITQQRPMKFGAGPNEQEPLSFGADIGEVDMNNLDGLGYSMGQTGDIPASQKAMFALGQDDGEYPDAILRMLQAQDAAMREQKDQDMDNPNAGKTAAATYFDALTGSEQPVDGLSMGETVAPPAAAPTGGSPAPGANPGAGGENVSTKSPDEGSEALTGPVEKLLNAAYGTKMGDLSEDEKRDRRRAITLALSEGFQGLSRGSDMDFQPIVTQRMELQQMRRANEDLKKNAQGVADMMVAAGYGEQAQLAFMGPEGMATAMQMLGRVGTRAENAPFDLTPEMRATTAQTLSDMGRPDMAQMVLSAPPGDGLKGLYDTFLGMDAPGQYQSPEKGSDPVLTPEQIAARTEAQAAYFDSVGDPTTAQGIRSGAIDFDTANKAIEQRTAVAPAIDTDIGKTATELEAEQLRFSTAAEGAAAAYDSLGRPDLAAAYRASGDPAQAQEAVSVVTAERAALQEQEAIKRRGEAVANLIPDDLPNSAELKEAARTAQTSQDIDGVLQQALPSLTDEQKLIEASKDDPELFEKVKELRLAMAGKEKLTFGASAAYDRAREVSKNYAASKASNDAVVKDMETLRALAANPEFESGKLQGVVLAPLQNWANSILGENAPDLMSDDGVLADRLMTLIRDNNFTSASILLKGAISDKETQSFKNTFASTSDSRMQILSIAQYQIKKREMMDLEYRSMMDYIAETEAAGKQVNEVEMLDYVNKKTEGFELFETVEMDDLEKFYEGNPPEGTVYRVYDPTTGRTFFDAVGNFD